MNVYDFDHTIYSGDSSVDFFLYVLSRRPYLAALLPYQIWGTALYLFGIIPKERMKERFFIFLRFIPVQKMAAGFWNCNYKKIKPWYLRQKQDSDVVISASPECILEKAVCGLLGVTLIATKIELPAGRLAGKNCFGKEKVTRFFEMYPEGGIDFFYSDSFSDTPLSQKAKQSFMVRGRNITAWNDYRETFLEKIKRTYFSKEFILFVFCGGAGTLINFIFSLLFSMRLNPSAAYIFGYGISLFASYSLNAKLIFRKKISASGFLRFVVSYIPNFLILFTFVFVFINLLGWNKVAVYALAGLLGLPLTFLLVKIMVFAGRQ